MALGYPKFRDIPTGDPHINGLVIIVAIYLHESTIIHCLPINDLVTHDLGSHFFLSSCYHSRSPGCLGSSVNICAVEGFQV